MVWPGRPQGHAAGLLNKIADEAVRAAATEGARSVVAQQGGDMVASTPVEFASFIEAERSRYETIVREAGMTVD
jgi:tripartite-type tricarboxylate transporter receptor subunit TctC